MAHVNASIGINIKATNATGQLAALQAQLASLNKQMVAGSAAATAAQTRMAASMANAINKSGMWNAAAGTMMTSTGRMMQQFDKGTMSFRQWQETSRRATKAMGDNAVMNQMAAQRVRALQTQYMALGREVDGTQKVMKMQPTGMMRDWGAEAMFAQQKAALFHRRLQMGANSMINWGKNTQWAGRQMMVGMGIPLGIAAVGAVRSFKDIEQASISFKRVYGDATTSAGEKTQMLGKIQTGVAQEMTKYGIAVADTIDVAAKAAATGQKGTDLVTATRETMRLATLGQLDYDQALESTIATQTAFGVSAKGMVRVTDFLNAAENQTILSMDDMTKAIPRVAPVIKGLGGDVEDLGVLMTALRAGGVSAEQGANALKSGLASLINPTSSASEAMKNFGIPLEKIVKTNKGDLIGTVKDFGKALQQLPKFEQQQALEALFGKYQYARMGALFRNINKKQAQETEKLSNETSANLAKMSEDELSQISESAMNKFQGAVERLKAAAAPLGEAILSTLAPVVDVLAKIVGFFADNSAARNILLFGAAFAGLAGVAVMLTGVFANFFGTMMKGFLAARRGMAALRGRPIPRYESLADLEAANAQRQLGAAASAAAKGLYAEAEAANVLANALARLRGATGGAISAVPQTRRGGGFAGGAGVAVGPTGPTPTGSTSGAAAKTSSSQAKSLSVLKKEAGLYKAPSVVRSQTAKMAWTTRQAEVAAMTKAMVAAGASQKQIDNVVKSVASHIDPTKDLVKINGVDTKLWKAGNLVTDLQGINQYVENASKYSKSFAGGMDGLAKAIGGGRTAKDLEFIAQGMHPVTRAQAEILRDVAKHQAATAKAGSSSAMYASAAAAGLDVRLQGDYYETLAERNYDAKKDAVAEKSVRARAQQVGDELTRSQTDQVKQTSAAAKQTEKAVKKESSLNKDLEAAKRSEISQRSAVTRAQNKVAKAESQRAKYLSLANENDRKAYMDSIGLKSKTADADKQLLNNRVNEARASHATATAKLQEKQSTVRALSMSEKTQRAINSNLAKQEKISTKGFSGRQFAAGLMGPSAPSKAGGGLWSAMRAGGAFTGDKANAWSNKLFGLGMAADMVTMGLVAAGKEVPAWTHMVGMGMMTLGMFPSIVGKPAKALGAGMKAATVGIAKTVTPALSSVGSKLKTFGSIAAVGLSEMLGLGSAGVIGGGLGSLGAVAGGVALPLAALGGSLFAIKKTFDKAADRGSDMGAAMATSQSAVDAFANETGKETASMKQHRIAVEQATDSTVTQAEVQETTSKVQSQAGQAMLQQIQAAKDSGGNAAAASSTVAQAAGLYGEGLMNKKQTILFAAQLADTSGLQGQTVDIVAQVKEIINNAKGPLEVQAKLTELQISPEAMASIAADFANNAGFMENLMMSPEMLASMGVGAAGASRLMQPGAVGNSQQMFDSFEQQFGAGSDEYFKAQKEFFSTVSAGFDTMGYQFDLGTKTGYDRMRRVFNASDPVKIGQTGTAADVQKAQGVQQGVLDLQIAAKRGDLSREGFNNVFNRDDAIVKEIALNFKGANPESQTLIGKTLGEMDGEELSWNAQNLANAMADPNANVEQLGKRVAAYQDLPATRNKVQVDFATTGVEEIKALGPVLKEVQGLPPSIQKRIDVQVQGKEDAQNFKKDLTNLNSYIDEFGKKDIMSFFPKGKGVGDVGAKELSGIMADIKKSKGEIEVKTKVKPPAAGDVNAATKGAKPNPIKVDVKAPQAKQVESQLKNVKKAASDAGKAKANVKVKAQGAKAVTKELNDVKRVAKQADRAKANVKVKSQGARSAIKDLNNLRNSARRVGNAKANVKVRSSGAEAAQAKLQEVRSVAKQVGNTNATVKTTAPGATEASSQLIQVFTASVLANSIKPIVTTSAPGAIEAFSQLTMVATAANLVPRTVTISVSVVGAEAAGGQIEELKNKAAGSAMGGYIAGYAGGGSPFTAAGFKRRSSKISGPGGPRADKIPTMLSDGEFVVRASSVNKYGTGFLHKVNRGQIDPSSVRYLNNGDKADGKNTPGKKTKGSSSDGDKKDKNTGWKDLKKELKNLRLTFESTNKLIGSKKFTKGRIPINLLDQALQTDDPKAMKELLNKKMSKVRADARKALRQEEAKNFFAEYNESMKTLKAQKARAKALSKGSIRNREFESKLSDAELIYFNELNGKARKKWRKTKQRQFDFEKRNVFYEEKLETNIATKRNASRLNIANTNSQYAEQALSMSDASVDEFNRLEAKINSTTNKLNKSKKKKQKARLQRELTSLQTQQQNILFDEDAKTRRQEQVDKKLETIQNYRSRKESLGQEKKFSKFVAGGRQATGNLIGLNQTALTSLSQEDFELLNALDDPAAIMLFTAALNEAAEAARQAAVAERQLGITKETQFSNRFSSALTAGLSKDALAGLSAEDFEMMLTMTTSELAAFKNQLNAAAEAAKRSEIQAMSQGERMQEMSGLLDNLSQSYKDQAIAVAEQNILNQSGLTKAQIEANIQRDQLEVSKKQQEATIQQREIDDINKQYDEQAKILDKIGQTQQIISNLQKGRLSVASALSSGDIAAAAAAAQEQRSAEAQANIDMMRQALQDEKEQKIEQRQDIIDGLQDDIDILNDSIFEATTLIEQNMVDAAISGAAMSREIDIQNTRLKASSTYWSAIRADINESIGRMLDVAGSDFSGILSQTGQLNEAWQTYANTLGSIPGLLENAGGTVGTQGAPAGGGGAGGADTTGTGSSSNSVGSQSAAGDKTKWEKFVDKLNKLKQQSDKEFILKKAVGKGTPMGKWQQKFKALKESNKDLLLSAMDGANVKPGERQKISNTAGFYAKGGWIPGVGNKDSVHAMVMPGEFIVNKRSAKMFGPILEKMNNPNYKFAQQPGMTSGSSMINSNNVYNVTVNAGAGSNADEIATITLNKIKELDRMNIREMRKF